MYCATPFLVHMGDTGLNRPSMSSRKCAGVEGGPGGVGTVVSVAMVSLQRNSLCLPVTSAFELIVRFLAFTQSDHEVRNWDRVPILLG